MYAIVVTYNGEKWIRKCLDSLQNSSIPVHILVIDNKSTDKTTEIIEIEFPSVHLIKSEKNLGFGRGNNIGLRLALKENADYVFLLNQDAWIEKNTISDLINAQKANPTYGILGPFHLKPNKKEIEFYFSTIISPDYCPGLISDLYFGNMENVYETRFIHAAVWLISKECLMKVGGFDPLFPHYGEDEDYVSRAFFFNFKVGIVPCAKVYHDINFDIEKIKTNLDRNIINSILQLKKINSSFRSNFLVYVKTSMDELTSNLLYRKFKRFAFNVKVFWKSVVLTKKILKSRKESIKEMAFLKA